MNHICMILHVSELYLPCHSLPFFLVSRDQADGSAQRRCCVKVRSSLSTWTTAGAFLRSHNSTLSLQVPSRSQSIQSRYGLGGVFAVLLVVPISVRFSTCFSNVSFWLLQSVRCGREMWWGWCHFRIHRDLWSMDVASMEDAALVQIDSLIDR